MTHSPTSQTEPDHPWQINISGGAHHGTSVPLAAGSYTLGGSLDNDFVLADPAIAEQQVRIDVSPQGAVATPLAVGLTRGRRTLTPGQPFALRSGALLRMGSMQIRMSGPCRPVRRPLWAIAVGAVLMLSGSFAAAFQLASPALVQTNASPRPAPAALAASADAGAARDGLGQRLRLAGLDEKVTLAAGERAVTATGTLLPGERDAWLAAQQWFDGRFGHSTVLVDRVGFAAAQEMPSLDIAAVALRPIPHVITRDGEQYIIGAVLTGGWSISAISGRAVTLSRGGRTIDIAL